MSVSGVKSNKCFATGLQGVTNLSENENTSGSAVIFAVDNPANNGLYLFKEYTSGVFGLMPENPTPDFNFNITIQKTGGFTGTLAGLVMFAYSGVNETPAEYVTIKWDNPSFDITNSYTVIHMHIWYDGINYCGHVDGY